MLGETISHYKILEKLGQGGMGEVYRATDTRLGRDVALKILPANLSQSADRKVRFEREAKTISKLSHPGICTLHDFGQHDGTPYLVMELLKGETLAERLSSGPISVEDALRWGAEIAEALDCSHARGIVHRDLKPSNVMLTATGLKLLDFGLAKESADLSGPGDLTEALTKPISEIPLTKQGTILGTVPYMAPEQLQGRPADARSDLFALGAVLYEMLTGTRAFGGDSDIALAASILEREPEPISTLAPQVPPALERTVGACLKKDPEQRWQSARDVARELRWIEEDRARATVPAEVASRRRIREGSAWAVAVLALIVAVYFGSRQTNGAQAPKLGTTRFTLETSVWRSWDPAVSPDGRKILYRSYDANRTGSRFRIRFLDSLEPLELPGAEDFAETAFWSPDSRFVAYTSGGKLLRLPISGGPPEIVCAANGKSSRGDWHASGSILFDGGEGGLDGISKVDASGGDAAPVFMPDATGETVYHSPSFLPDGRRCLFLEAAPDEQGGGRLLCGDLVTGQTTDLGLVDSKAVYAEPGYVLYVSGTTLVARPFDLDRARFTGLPRSLAEINPNAPNLFSVSASGVLVYQSPRVARGHLVWLDRRGRPLENIEVPGEFFGPPSVSPDGRRLAVSLTGPEGEDIWIYDLGRQTLSRLTVSPGQDASPIWSPDGRWIDYGSKGEDSWLILRASASDGGIRDTLATSDPDYWWHMPVSWSSDDGSLIVESLSKKGSRHDILVADVSGAGTLEPFVATPFLERSPSLSPDDRWLAYVSDESGRNEVYVRPFPEGEGRWQISRSGGGTPRWRGDGKELVYSTLEHLMAVDVDTSKGFEASAPRTLFELPETVMPYNFDLTSDGERTIWVEWSDEMTEFVAVLNWASELE